MSVFELTNGMVETTLTKEDVASVVLMAYNFWSSLTTYKLLPLTPRRFVPYGVMEIGGVALLVLKVDTKTPEESYFCKLFVPWSLIRAPQEPLCS